MIGTKIINWRVSGDMSQFPVYMETRRERKQEIQK